MAWEHGSCSSCISKYTVRALPKRPDILNLYVDQVRQLFMERKLPDLSQYLHYKVYHIRSSPLGGHSSIVVTHDCISFVTIELNFVKVDGEDTVYPLSRPYNGDKTKLEYCGAVQKTGYELFQAAGETIFKFGGYNYLFNNCQHYANDLLQKLNLKKVKTDAEKVTDYTSTGKGGASYCGN